MQVAKIHTEADDTKISNLIYYLGPRAGEIFATFTIDEADKTKYNVVKHKYEDYFILWYQETL